MKETSAEEIAFDKRMEPLRKRWARKFAQDLSARNRAGGGKSKTNKINTTGEVMTIEIDTTGRAAAIEREVKKLSAAYLHLDQPDLVERAGRYDYRDVRLQKTRTDREETRRWIEEQVVVLAEEHQQLCARDKSITPLDPQDSPQLAELRKRLRTENLTLGRFRVLGDLPAGKVVGALRRQKLVECEAEIAHLERVIARIEAARAPAQADDAGN